MQDGRTHTACSMPAPTNSTLTASRPATGLIPVLNPKNAGSLALFSPSRDLQALFSPQRDSGCFIPETEGLLGHAAASSRDMPILAPGCGDSRDGLCAEDGLSRDVHCLLMHSSMVDNNSMCAMLDHSRHATQGEHGNTVGSLIHSNSMHAVVSANVAALRDSMPVPTPPYDKCFADSQV